VDLHHLLFAGFDRTAAAGAGRDPC
jgi:hypothetical protein